MVSNIWVEKDFQKELISIFKKKKFDLIPATCNGKQGCCIVSVPPDEVKKALSAFDHRGVITNLTGTMTAQIEDTTIILDVLTISKR